MGFKSNVDAALPLGLVVGLRAEARIARRYGRAAVGGGSAEGALEAAHRLAASGVCGLVSFGLAGGLDPRLAPGSVAVPELILYPRGIARAHPALAARFGGFRGGPHLAAREVVTSAAGKAGLFARTEACSVDLETEAVIEAANAHSLPFLVVRAICDPAHRDLPKAALLALDQRGAIGLGRVIASLLRAPGQLPALLALARDAAAARAALLSLAVNAS